MESVNYNKLLKCPHHSASPAIHFSNKTSPTEVNFHVGCVLLQSNSFHWKLFLSINKPFLSELPQQHKQAFLHFFTNKPSTIFISKVATMFSLTSMPSTASVLSTYTTFAASAMLVRTVLNEVQNMTSQLVPNQLQEKILAGVGDFFGYSSSQMTLIIEEYNGFSINQMYESSETYLRTKVTPSVEKLRVSKSPREKKISVTINKGEKVVDVFGGIQLKWQMICTVSKQTSEEDINESRSIELSFHKKYMEKVLNFYLPHVMNTSKAIKEENKVVKLYSLGSFGGEYEGGVWGFTNLDHPSTFDTLAMDPVLKKELIDDLERFVKRRNFYRRVGKAWKRGYLLYGPPGTGKSSLIAAMANHLKFNIYDLELTSLKSNSDLRRLLVSTTNKSIVVIEDIDCSIELQDRHSVLLRKTLCGIFRTGFMFTVCQREKLICKHYYLKNLDFKSLPDF